MPGAPKYSVGDWLNLHNLTQREALEYCSAIKSACRPEAANFPAPDSTVDLTFDLGEALRELILPSLENSIGISGASGWDLSSVKIIQYESGKLDLPYTEWSDNDNAPVIHLVWSKSVGDLICLAHEMAHAAQMILSENSFMPPIGREICAFLGELAFIHCMRQHNATLYRALRSAWHSGSKYYFFEDTDMLVASLKKLSTRYTYRHNYPFALVAGMFLFSTRSPSELRELFAGGSTVMQQIPFKDIFTELTSSTPTKMKIAFLYR